MIIPKITIPFVFNYQAVEVELQRQCKYLFRKKMGMDVTLSLRFDVPENLETLILQNRTLKANITLTWTGSGKTINIEFPAPYHGVFIIRSEFDNKSSKRIWIPTLIDKQGEWLLKKYKATGVELLHRKVFPCGRFLELSLTDENTKSKKKKLPLVLQLDKTRIELLFKYDESTLRKEFTERTRALDPKTIKFIDEQDLKHQRLHTFDVSITERFLSSLLAKIKTVLKIEKIKAAELFQNSRLITHDVRTKIWTGLKQRERAIGWGLVQTNNLIKNGYLKLFNPLNNIDAISQLTSLKRYPYSKDLKAIYHQNHPSFRNIICPIETPESTEIGITVHLAKGVKTDIWGNFYKNKNDDNYLGYAASLVPFYQHNDAVRVMMGAKNLRQAIPVKGTESPWVTTGCEQAVVELSKPLVTKKLLLDHFTEFKPGQQLLVAYMPWYGYNFEDAIVANKRLREEGLMDWVIEEDFFQLLKPGYSINAEYSQSLIGQDVKLGTAIAEITKDSNVYKLTHTGHEVGLLKQVTYLKPKSTISGSVIKWKVEFKYPIQVGSKLMARYGNKGVISQLLTSKELPRLPNDPNIPENLRGRAVDLVLNPHGVISRMNLGQLMETHYGLGKNLGIDIPEHVGRGFRVTDIKRLGEIIDKKSGFDKYGRIRLVLPDGSLTDSPVVVGQEYFVLLNHIPSKKAHARRGGSNQDRYNLVTGQPVGGKRNKGGQRIGEMEMWALSAHRAENIINEILTYKSDPSSINNSTSKHGQQTQAMFDHLFMLGIKYDEKNNASFTADEDVANKGPLVTNGKTREIFQEATFRCVKCDSKFLGGEMITTANRYQRPAIKYGIKKGDPFVSVQDLLDYSDVKILSMPEGELTPQQGQFRCELQTDKELLKLEFDVKKDDIILRFLINNNLYCATNRFSDKKKFPISELTKMIINCPKRVSHKLIATNPKKLLIDEKEGLYDQVVYGTPDIKFLNTGWGHIDLPIELEHPLIKNLTINKIPVLPLKYRYTSAASYLKENKENEITELYSWIINTCQTYGEDKKKQIKLKRHVNKLYREIKSRVFGPSGRTKFGMMRRYGMGRRVDYSGRFVIIPYPCLGWDECSVPADALFVLFGDQLANWVKDDIFKIYFQKCRYLSDVQDEGYDQAYQYLQSFLNEKKTIRVLLNRQPSLHKYSILSFRPIPHKASEGMVLKLNPLVFKGFGADADGDEMTIHCILGSESLNESKRLSPMHMDNFLSDANREPLIDFDQDYVLGNYLKNGEDKKSGYIRLGELVKPEINLEKIIPDEMRDAFEKVTRAGVSFSYLELLDCIIDRNSIDKILNSKKNKINDDLGDLTINHLKTNSKACGSPGYFFGAMAISKARGTKQARQMLAARGSLRPGAIGFNKRRLNYIIHESLIDGMTLDSSYASTFNARNSMIEKNIGTYSAGYLTRRLVLALWPWHVVNGNCGRGNIFRCKYHSSKTICSGCFKDKVADRYPVGLITAQTLGERCTQLTMSSFHTGTQEISIVGVEKILSKPPKTYYSFEKQIRKASASEKLLEIHVKMLWIAISTSKKLNLAGAIAESMTPLSMLVGLDGFNTLCRFIKKHKKSQISISPIDNLLLGISKREL